MVEKVAAGVKKAMAEAGITDPAEVHYVQTKTPLLTMETINDARSRGQTVWTEEPLESMNLSNGTTALGIAVALGAAAEGSPVTVRRSGGLRSLPKAIDGICNSPLRRGSSISVRLWRSLRRPLRIETEDWERRSRI
jgi:hypothetical protein